MRLTFIGADHEVTGSCHLLQACGLNILVDCGMEQGINKFENAELPISYSDVDYVGHAVGHYLRKPDVLCDVP